MSFIGQIITTLCAVFPAWVVVVALGFLALSLIFIIVKLVAFVLDAVPFL